LLDPNEFRRQGHQVIDFIADYYARMDDYPVHPSVSPGFLRHQLPANAPSRSVPRCETSVTLSCRA
jgi:tyrosine decarboxylase